MKSSNHTLLVTLTIIVFTGLDAVAIGNDENGEKSNSASNSDEVRSSLKQLDLNMAELAAKSRQLAAEVKAQYRHGPKIARLSAWESVLLKQRTDYLDQIQDVEKKRDKLKKNMADRITRIGQRVGLSDAENEHAQKIVMLQFLTPLKSLRERKDQINQQLEQSDKLLAQIRKARHHHEISKEGEAIVGVYQLPLTDMSTLDALELEGPGDLNESHSATNSTLTLDELKKLMNDL